jgi:hypothetical protein
MGRNSGRFVVYLVKGLLILIAIGECTSADDLLPPASFAVAACAAILQATCRFLRTSAFILNI